MTLLDKYGISYVYVGLLERSEYDPRGLEKFGRFMETVYQNDGVVIYKTGKWHGIWPIAYAYGMMA